LKSAIADSLNLVPTPDGEGYVWQAPANLPARIVDEAQRAAKQLEHALKPATEDVKAKWLAQLAQLCAPVSAEDGLTRLRAIARDLDHPPLCFTDETRIAAARRFKFFPSFAELAGFLDGVRHPYRERLGRLRQIRPALPAPVESEAEFIARRQAMVAKLGDLAAMLRGEKPWPDGTRGTACHQQSADLYRRDADR